MRRRRKLEARLNSMRNERDNERHKRHHAEVECAGYEGELRGIRYALRAWADEGSRRAREEARNAEVFTP